MNYQHIVNKLLSGKFIMTVIASIVFAYCSINKIIEPKDTVTILCVIVYAYFSKPTTPTNGDQDGK
jgi:hypothetical protein